MDLLLSHRLGCWYHGNSSCQKAYFPNYLSEYGDFNAVWPFSVIFPHAFYLLQISWESFTTHSSKSISKVAGGNAEHLTVRTDAKPDFM